MNYIIYKTTCVINNKYYYGKHKCESLRDGYLGSGTILKRAIKKYGVENFIREVLFELSSEEEMNIKEASVITKEVVDDELSYNLCLGGMGGFSYINSKGLNLFGYYDKKCVVSLKKAQDRVRELSSDSGSEWCKNRDKAISKGLKKYIKENGALFSGKTHTEDAKKKIGKANSKYQSGDGNSQYGTQWIYSPEAKESKRISKKDPIPDGWVKGRKIKFNEPIMK